MRALCGQRGVRTATGANCVPVRPCIVLSRAAATSRPRSECAATSLATQASTSTSAPAPAPRAAPPTAPAVQAKEPGPSTSQVEHQQEDLVKVFVSIGRDFAPPRNPLGIGEGLRSGLKALKRLGVDGVVLEFFWGAVEDSGPAQYDWQEYKRLVRMVRDLGMKVKVSLCMYGVDQCPLPQWLRQVGEQTPDIYYMDRAGNQCKECLSLGTDHVPVLQGRTGLQAYADLISSFRSEFSPYLGSTITDVVLAVGPSGELKYPSHPADKRWTFPGIGEYQCYDRFMLSMLRASAQQLSQPSWGHGGPHDAGSYCLWPHQTGFFQHANGNWSTTYGRFFLQWYSDMLARHALDVAAQSERVMQGSGVQMFVKIPGVHWWYNTAAHAPELTTGYYNTSTRDGYMPVFKALARHDVGVHLGLAEMRNSEQLQQAFCDPEKLLLQQRTVAAALQLPVVLENSSTRFDDAALSRLEGHLFDYTTNMGIELPPVQCLVFNSASEAMFQPENWNRFKAFMGRLQDRAERAAVQNQNERSQAALAEKEEAARGPPTGRPVFA